MTLKEIDNVLTKVYERRIALEIQGEKAKIKAEKILGKRIKPNVPWFYEI